MADMLSDRGIAPMHATTIAKIEAGTRSVRINEAVAIADLFDVSLDSLSGRQSATKRVDLTYGLVALRGTTAHSAGQIAGIAAVVGEALDELPGEFDGVDKLKEMGYNTLRKCLNPASNTLMQLSSAADRFLREQERLEASRKALTESGVLKDEAQS
jgi:Helix-turn-helix